MLCGYRTARIAILSFRRRKDAFGKTWSAEQHFANPRNFDNVYTDGNDHN